MSKLAHFRSKLHERINDLKRLENEVESRESKEEEKQVSPLFCFPFQIFFSQICLES